MIRFEVDHKTKPLLNTNGYIQNPYFGEWCQYEVLIYRFDSVYIYLIVMFINIYTYISICI